MMLLCSITQPAEKQFKETLEKLKESQDFKKHHGLVEKTLNEIADGTAVVFLFV